MPKPSERFVLLAASIAAAGFFATAVMVSGSQPQPRQLTTNQEAASAESDSINYSAFAHLTLEAKAAIVYDPVTGKVIYDLHKNAQLPIASITKVMTAIVAAENSRPDTIISNPDGQWRLADLIEYTLVSSSNEGARSLALVGASQALASPVDSEKNFITLMNKKAKVLGLAQTYFTNVTGLDINKTYGGSYSSAEDIAKLLTYGLKEHSDLLGATRQPALDRTTLDTTHHVAINTNELTGQIPGLLAGKTGFTDVASGNLAIAFDRGLNQPLIIVVLGSSLNGRFNDMKHLVAASLTAF